jgi:hypothetical protein
MKKAIVLAVLLNISIQVTGTSNSERSALSARTLEIYFTHYMAPPVPSNDHKKKHILEMSHIMHDINANESTIPKAPEHINLKRGLHT